MEAAADDCSQAWLDGPDWLHASWLICQGKPSPCNSNDNWGAVVKAFATVPLYNDSSTIV